MRIFLRFWIKTVCCALAISVGTGATTSAASYDLTTEQIARLKKYLPNAFEKLLKRDPVNMVAVGDGVMDFYVHDADSGNALKSYGGIFAQMLADQFYYTGGVRIHNPRKNMPEKAFELSGPEIILHNVSRSGKLMIHAMQALSTLGMAPKPDLAMVSFGINDSDFGLDLGKYRRALQEVVDYTKQQGVELLLFGPTLIAPDPPEKGFGLTRPYADVMREVADANGIFYADLGDLAWLVHLDERFVPVPIKKEKASDATTPVINSVKIPVSDDADTDPEKKAALFFSQVANGYRHCLDAGDSNAWLHPNALMHRTLARRAFDELLDGPKAVPWKVGGAVVQFESDTKCVLTYHIENSSKADLRVYLLPLITRDWVPQEAKSYVDLKPGARSPVNVVYLKSKQTNTETSALMPATEMLLRLPVLLMGGGLTRIETLRAEILPLTLLWETGTQFNQGKTFTISGSLSNNGNDPLKLKWETEWMGQKQSGAADLKAGGNAPVKLAFNLPDENAATARKGLLVFKTFFGGKTLHFNRTISIAQNFGLRQKMPLSGSDAVVFRADADDGALYLTWDITGLNLEDNPDGSGALSVEVNLDARSYGKRLTPGATDALRVACAAADGDAISGPMLPWMFGPGYTTVYDANAVKGHLSSRADGSRRFTLMVPRTSFYLHEWALGNGNSQLGINSAFYYWQRVTGSKNTGGRSALRLENSELHRDDADSLGVLELTDKPTRRWTVRVY